MRELLLHKKRPRMTHCVYQLILVLRGLFICEMKTDTQTHTSVSFHTSIKRAKTAEKKKCFNAFEGKEKIYIKQNLDEQDKFIPLHCDLIELCI